MLSLDDGRMGIVNHENSFAVRKGKAESLIRLLYYVLYNVLNNLACL